MKFTLEVELGGNEAMQTGVDVAKAVEDVSLWLIDDGNNLEVGTSGAIYDTNGNRVGKWEVS